MDERKEALARFWAVMRDGDQTRQDQALWDTLIAWQGERF